ncbi:hypothetical protein [Brunnivagina elsteri]|uniref:Uncharacterized protein n=1 Tax=Brunnivagina elsteri CCALA 953 TaxID=987040 RepID=A0A2A2TCQ3_9CYAN|nr:hypothetical protein [Calothrix elsteri]PAX51530.1 hypothetical protein CK510_24320 [Calothrix elsteri CCALA 953]
MRSDVSVINYGVHINKILELYPNPQEPHPNPPLAKGRELVQHGASQPTIVNTKPARGYKPLSNSESPLKEE